MFTGLVEAVGRVEAREPLEEGSRITVGAEGLAADLEPGESVAVDGVCLTVVDRDAACFAVEAIRTTVERSTASEWDVGRRLNLERALAVGDRLGGHLVQGHVDGTGRVVEVRPEGETVRLRIELPGDVARVTVSRGSLAVDGVSLTVAGLRDEVAEVAIIPYTWSRTALSRLSRGDRVNLEADLVGKYVARLAEPHLPPGGGR